MNKTASNLTRAVLSRAIEDKADELIDAANESLRLSQELQDACAAYIQATEQIIKELDNDK